MPYEQPAAAVHLVVSELTVEASARARYAEIRREHPLLPNYGHERWMIGRDWQLEDPMMTRHWALRIQGRYFELARVHENNTVAFEPNSIAEPARAICQVNMMGYTHYSEKEVCNMGHAIARELQTYSLLSSNCQTLCSKLLVKILCQDRAHNHDFYIFAPEFIEAGVSETFQVNFLYFTLVHANAYIGFSYAIISALLGVPWLGNLIFLGTGYFLIKWLIFKPFKALLSLIGIVAGYNVFVLYGPTGFRT